METSSALAKAIQICGSQAALATKIGATQQRVSLWLKKPKCGVPAEYVLPIERATRSAVTRFELRPDLYPVDDIAPPVPACFAQETFR